MCHSYQVPEVTPSSKPRNKGELRTCFGRNTLSRTISYVMMAATSLYAGLSPHKITLRVRRKLLCQERFLK